MNVKAVTFDCWGTLITDSGFSSAMAARVDALADALDLDGPEAATLMDRAWRMHHNEWINAKQYGSEGMARFCMSEAGLDDPEACARLQEALEEAGRTGSQRALDGAVDTLRMLRAAGIRTALVCDAGFTPGRIVRDFLDEHGLLEHLEFCAFSNEVGVPKPHDAIFRAALDAVETDPTQAVHVGDLLRTDVYGAKQLGMGTIRITDIGDDAVRGFSWNPDAAFGGHEGHDGEQPKSPYADADVVVASHAEIPGALRTLGAPL
jgi:FMN phosphatase YigB (HAD superfamily)